MQGQTLTRDELLMKFGVAQHDAGRAANLIEVTITQSAAAVPQAGAATTQDLGCASAPAYLGHPCHVVKTYGLALNQIKHLAVLPGAS